jgi:hypothetical protein
LDEPFACPRLELTLSQFPFRTIIDKAPCARDFLDCSLNLPSTDQISTYIPPSFGLCF